MIGDDESDDTTDPFPDEYDGPTVDVPTVDAPDVEPDPPSADDVTESKITKLFVLHVVVWNAVLLFFSLGVMLIYFRQNWEAGGRLIALSAVFALYGVYRWPDDVGGVL